MDYMFADTSVFDSILQFWDVSKVVTMEGMFMNAIAFKGLLLRSWNVSSDTVLDQMLCNATNINPFATASWKTDAVNC